jgi:threonine 3-dehydrogenase
VTDVNPARLALAARMGATRTVDVSKESLRDVQREQGMKEGFDVGLEMSGNPRALTDMIDNMTHGGRIALLGIMPEKAAVDWNKVVFNMLTIRGIYGREMYETWYKMIALIQSGLDISPVITHRFPYTDFQEAFELMSSGRSGKIVLNWETA